MVKPRVKFFQYLRLLMENDSGESSKSFSLVIASLVGAVIGLSVAFCLVVDVLSDGNISTDLDSLGIFLLCVGGYMAGGGFNKAVMEHGLNKKKKEEESEGKSGT